MGRPDHGPPADRKRHLINHIAKPSIPMASIFKDVLHEQLGTWPLAYIPYGAADYGEILSIARTVGDGDDGVFHATWTDAANRLMEEGADAEAKGHRATASEVFLKAACFYAKSYHPLFGEPVDPRVVSASRSQIDAFDRGLALCDDPVTPMRIPFGKSSLLAYLIPAKGRARERRPLLIVTNGYDASITDAYFASAVAASRRGYHCLIFDGPGQGTALIENGMRLRPDWETVIGAVVDAALTLSEIDTARISLAGWSLGGYLAPRAASGEHRLAACIADPAQFCIADGFRTYAMKLGASKAEAGHLGELPQSFLDRMEQTIANDRKLRWSVIQRGYWVNGATNLRDYLKSVEEFTMAGRVESIRCPTLCTVAEDDPIAAWARVFFDALQCPKMLLPMARLDGAGDHCEMGNRSLLNRRVFDWLDEVL